MQLSKIARDTDYDIAPGGVRATVKQIGVTRGARHHTKGVLVDVHPGQQLPAGERIVTSREIRALWSEYLVTGALRGEFDEMIAAIKANPRDDLYYDERIRQGRGRGKAGLFVSQQVMGRILTRAPHAVWHAQTVCHRQSDQPAGFQIVVSVENFQQVMAAIDGSEQDSAIEALLI